MFDISLSATAKVQFASVVGLVAEQLTVGKITEVCKRIGSRAQDTQSALIYAAILEANLGPRNPVHMQRAIALLAEASPHPYAVFLKRYLEERKAFVPSATAFQSPIPYDVWSATEFHRGYRAETLRALRDFIQKTPPDTQMPTICDIGPGNGLLLADMIAGIFEIYALPMLRVVLIEKSQGMLQATQTLLAQRFGQRVQTVAVHGKIEELDGKTLLAGAERFWFINAAASLHHMPAEVKAEVFGKLAGLSQQVVVSDFIANHDLPDFNSPEFVYSVANFYGYIMADIWACNTESEERRWQCICDIMLTESITMLGQPRAHRIDYHAPVEQWEAAAQRGSYRLVSSRITARDELRPVSFTAVFAQ